MKLRTNQITRGKVEGDKGGGKEEGSSRNIYKDHMDKAKGGRIKGERRGWLG